MSSSSLLHCISTAFELYFHYISSAFLCATRTIKASPAAYWRLIEPLIFFLIDSQLQTSYNQLHCMWNKGRNTRVYYTCSHCFPKLHIHPGGRGAVMHVKYRQKCTPLHFISKLRVLQGCHFVCIFTKVFQDILIHWSIRLTYFQI